MGFVRRLAFGVEVLPGLVLPVAAFAGVADLPSREEFFLARWALKDGFRAEVKRGGAPGAAFVSFGKAETGHRLSRDTFASSRLCANHHRSRWMDRAAELRFAVSDASCGGGRRLR